MGRGDQRSKRGKIARGTAGKTRPNPKQKKRAKAAKKKAVGATQE
jgi:ribosomal small subunit protein bTHX